MTESLPNRHFQHVEAESKVSNWLGRMEFITGILHFKKPQNVVCSILRPDY